MIDYARFKSISKFNKLMWNTTLSKEINKCIAKRVGTEDVVISGQLSLYLRQKAIWDGNDCVCLSDVIKMKDAL